MKDGHWPKFAEHFDKVAGSKAAFAREADCNPSTINNFLSCKVGRFRKARGIERALKAQGIDCDLNTEWVEGSRSTDSEEKPDLVIETNRPTAATIKDGNDSKRNQDKFKLFHEFLSRIDIDGDINENDKEFQSQLKDIRKLLDRKSENNKEGADDFKKLGEFYINERHRDLFIDLLHSTTEHMRGVLTEILEHKGSTLFIDSPEISDLTRQMSRDVKKIRGARIMAIRGSSKRKKGIVIPDELTIITKT